ncbi:rRNA maturation RNase YbeY [Patescibacteria group bacterium]|nr:MAG: rRNA maturation RNase YbeY [Patescibacteria group bacterium]
MRVSIEVQKRVKVAISNQLLKRVILRTVQKSQLAIQRRGSVVVGIAFVSDREIQRLNRCYRHVDAPTDILSFANYRTSQAVEQAPRGELALGELVISMAAVKRSAKERELSQQAELRYILSHGVLHLLGFKHGEKMFSIQDNLLKSTL